MGAKPRPVNVRVKNWYDNAFDVIFTLEGKPFQLVSPLGTQKQAEELKEKLQEMFDAYAQK